MDGESPEVVIKALGMSRPRIYEWLAAHRENGFDALEAKQISGRPSKLSGEQIRELYTWITTFWKKRAVVSGGANPDGLALAAFTASVTAALVHAGVSAVFIAPASMLVGLVVLSVFWALICEPESQSHIQTKPASGLTGQIVHYGFVLIVAAGGVWWVNQVLNYHRAMIDDIPYYQKHVTSGDLPRFWFHGNFPRPSSLMP